MNRLHRHAPLLLLLCAALSPPSPRAIDTDSARAADAVPQSASAAQATATHMAVIGYWPPNSPNWDSIPDGAVVVINPASGILKWNSDEAVGNTDEWTNLVEKLKDGTKHRDVIVLGYVPTGYFKHGIMNKSGQVIGPCSPTKQDVNPHCQNWGRIELQVKTYYDKIRRQGESSKLDGIFYDETAQDGMTTSYKDEFDMIRKTNLGRTTVFNVGTANSEALAATLEGEHIVLYESSPDGYSKNKKKELNGNLATLTSDAILNRHIKVWHLLHSVHSKNDMCDYVKLMNAKQVDYGYVTDIGETGAWDKPPKYWIKELKVFASPNETCKELLKD